MRLRARLDRLLKLAGVDDPHPLTIFLRKATPGLPVGRRAVWGGVGLEIVYDPAEGMPELPSGGSHKLLLGMDPDWV